MQDHTLRDQASDENVGALQPPVLGPVGPCSGGPSPDALRVDRPPLDRFGLAELGRAVVVGVVLVTFVLWAVLRWLVRPARTASSLLLRTARSTRSNTSAPPS